MPHLAALCGACSALLVLSTSSRCSPERVTLAALRSELSTLGVALLVLADNSLFYFNPRPGTPEVLSGENVDELRRAFGDPRRRPGALVVTLLEPDGRERFRWLGKERGTAHATLLEALQLARQSTQLPASFRSFSKRELLFYSLVGALNLVLSEHVTVEPSAPVAQA